MLREGLAVVDEEGRVVRANRALATVAGAPETAVPPERLARLFARSLRNPAFRAYVKAQLDAGTFQSGNGALIANAEVPAEYAHLDEELKDWQP